MPRPYPVPCLQNDSQLPAFASLGQEAISRTTDGHSACACGRLEVPGISTPQGQLSTSDAQELVYK